MRVWLDDERPMPDGYDIHVRNSEYMKCLIDTGLITKLSLDHDLGVGRPTGYDIAKYLEEKYANGDMNIWITFLVHSQNPVGVTNIKRALQSAYRYWTLKNHIVGDSNENSMLLVR